jgi:hypothetical protein
VDLHVLQSRSHVARLGGIECRVYDLTDIGILEDLVLEGSKRSKA